MSGHPWVPLMLTMMACGGRAELRQPHEPPTWPMENLVVQDAEPKPAALEPESPPEAEPNGILEEATPAPEPTDLDPSDPSPSGQEEAP